MCFHARLISGQPRQDDTETKAAAWFEPADLPRLDIHPSMRRRIDDALAARPEPTIA